MFLQGRGLNSSYAIFQDATGRAWDRVIALGIGVGSGYLFETTFKKEVYSDLTGERGTLMGAIQGLLLAQYETLRENGHEPSEAFNETVEELTQSLMPLFAENGMDWMYANCSTTAQRGALDWMGPMPLSLYLKNYTGRSPAVTKRSVLSIRTVSRIIVKVWKKNWQHCAKAKCGVQVQSFVNCARKTIDRHRIFYLGA